MPTTFWRWPHLPIGLLILALAACDSGTEPDPTPDIDAVALEAAVQSFFGPIEANADAQASLNSAWNDLAFEYGIVFAPASTLGRAGRMAVAPRLLDILLRPAVFFPEEVRGSTFVFDLDQEMWVVDEGRTGAPGDGIRIVYYRTTGNTGSFALPLEEHGYIDLTNEDTQNLSRLGTRIVRTAGGQTVLADFTQGYRVEETQTGTTDHFIVAGFISDGSQQLELAMLYDFHESASTGLQTYSFELAFDRDDASYSWGFTGETDAAGLYEDLFVIRLVQGTAATVMDLLLTGHVADGGDSGAGTLAQGSVTVADVHMNEQGNFSVSRHGGGAFTPTQSTQIQSLVFTMYWAGVFFLVSLPVLFF